jgi:hypothetical protein
MILPDQGGPVFKAGREVSVGVWIHINARSLFRVICR